MTIIALGISLLALSAPAQERYDERPSIETIQPGPAVKDSDWKMIKQGQIAFLAQILEVYRDHHVYFLARDMEEMHDLSQILELEPGERERMRLLNVSRTSVKSPHLMDYLRQEGISEETLKDGRQILFIDTGFNGTIPSAIRKLFDPITRAQIRTHMIVSAASEIPSSRVFLNEIDPEAPSLAVSRMQSQIESYEKMPRFTYRSTDYRFLDGRWVPVALEIERDGIVDRARSQEYRRDLVASARMENQRSFQEQRRIWRQVFLKRHDVQAMEAYLRDLIKKHGSFGEAIARDVLDLSITHFRLPISIDRIGLHFVPSASNMMTKYTLAEVYPSWADFFDDGNRSFRSALERGDRETLLKAMELPMVNVTASYLAEACLETPADSPQKPLADEIYSRMLRSTKFRYVLAERTFSTAYNRVHTQDIEDLIDAAIEAKESTVLELLHVRGLMRAPRCRHLF